MANELYWDMVLSEFEPQLRYSIHFQTNTLGKGMNPYPQYGLNSTTTIFLQGELWH